MTLREAARLLIWPRRRDKAFHWGVAGGAAGLVVAAIMFPSPESLFIAASLGLGVLGVLLGSGAAVVLLLCGYGAGRPIGAESQKPVRGSKPPNRPQ